MAHQDSPQREAARAVRIAALADRELRPPNAYGPASAFVLAEACRRAMLGAPKGRRDLDRALLEHLHPAYRGYLEPRKLEPRSDDGSRLMVCLLEDLTSALDKASDSEDLEPADDRDVEKERVERFRATTAQGLDAGRAGLLAKLLQQKLDSVND